MTKDGLTIQEGKTDAAPEEVGYKPAKIGELDALLAGLMEKKRIQGASYLMSRYGKVFAWRAMGPQSGPDPDAGPMMPDSIRPIASETKAVTAMAVMQLAERGQLYLKQPVSTTIDEFDTPLHGTIRIDHLLTHTSGLAADPGYLHEPYAANHWGQITKENWLQVILAGPLQNPVGTTWAYCTGGFFVLGEIVARVSGMPYTEYVRKNIIEPLGLARTFYTVPEPLHDQVCIVTEHGKERLKPREDAIDSFKAGGGLYSTPYDMWRVGQLLLNKGTLDGVEVLSRKSVEALTRNHLINTPAYYWGNDYRQFNYGMGIAMSNTNSVLITPTTFHHEGAGACALYVDPEEEFIVSFFVPFMPDAGWVGEALVCTQNVMWAGLE